MLSARFSRWMTSLTFCLLLCVAGSPAQAQNASAGKTLTVERIYSQPSLSGQLTRGLAWTPDGKEISYFETKGKGKEAKTELWVMDAVTGERRVLVATEKLESVLTAEPERATQATGLGRRPPPPSQRSPVGREFVFMEPAGPVR